jgi:hypothetical protein
MTDGKRRTLAEWLAEKQMNPNKLMRAGAGVSLDGIRHWVRTGKMPLEVEANHRSLAIADALGVPPELLDAGPTYRGFTEAGHRFFITTQGRDDRGWEASIDAWGPPKDVPEGAFPAVSHRVISDERVTGPTAEASLDALEQELRDLIRANSGQRGDADEALPSI